MCNSSFVGAQVLERWLTCVCWHVTWNAWIVSIEIVRKCLFNTRFYSFHFHLYLLRNSKVLFARAQRREVCDPLISCVWHVNFGWLSTNNPTWLQGVSSNICIFFASSHFWFHVFDVQLCFVGAQRGEMLIFVFLILTLWFWLDFGMRCGGTFYASVGEKITKEMSLLSAFTCVHHPMSLSRTSGIRKVTNLCLLACDLE